MGQIANQAVLELFFKLKDKMKEKKSESKEKKELIKIFTTQDNMQAEMIMSVLQDNDIPSVKEDLGNAGLMNLYGGNSKSGESIYILESDVERAMEILNGMGLEL